MLDAGIMTQRDPLIAGRYRLAKLLGSGGFGSVYLATDERLHRPVAIKVCSTLRLPPQEAAEAAQLFQGEALTLARLRHPGLTAIWDYFNEGEDWYLVMEYVPGETLRDHIRHNGGPLPQADAIDYARQLCAVLGYLHSQQPPVVFRDLKPGNVMITREGQLKLIDFGIARLFSPGKAADTSQFGTPGYAPPEQYGGQTEPRSDIYSLGVLLHQMLTGHNPAASPFALPPARALNLAVPQQLEALIIRATAYDIDDRIVSAEEFCTQLDEALVRPAPALTMAMPRSHVYPHVAHQPSVPPNRQPWTPTPQRIPSRPQTTNGIGRALTLIVLLIVLLGSVGVGAWLLSSHLTELRSFMRPIVVPVVKPGANIPQIALYSAPGPDGLENLFQLNPETGKTRQVTQMPQNISATQPALSADGTRIAYTRELREFDAETNSWQTAASEVWVMERDGAPGQRVLAGYDLVRSPAWSPDGKWLAVEAAEEGRGWRDHDILLVNVDSGDVRPIITTSRWEGGPAWSPDGSQIAFHARRNAKCMEIFAVNVQDGTERQVSHLGDNDCSDPNSGDYWPDWSTSGIAAGRKLAGKAEIVVLDAATGEATRLDTGPEAAGHPRWSTDGRHLLFELRKAANILLASYELETGTITPIETTHSVSHLADWN